MPQKHLCVLLFCQGLVTASATLFYLDPPNIFSGNFRVHNNLVWVIFISSKFDHVSPLLYALLWPPVNQRINYKLSSICSSFVTDTGPQYLADILKIYVPSWQLRSSSDYCLFQIPSVHTKSTGQHTFAYQGPTVRNKLLHNVRHTPFLDVFKTALKSELFHQKDLGFCVCVCVCVH